MFKERVNKIIQEDNLTTLRKAQLTMLEMLNEINKICQNNNIDYWLDSGTLLGAIRHKGFIPWDDDCDICMPRNDYEKFIEIAKRNLPNGMICESKDIEKIEGKNTYQRYKFTRIYYLDHFKSYSKYWNKYSDGIFIDIFPVDAVTPKMVNNKFFNILNISCVRVENPIGIREKVKYIIHKMNLENIWINKSKKLIKQNKDDLYVYSVETSFMKEEYVNLKSDIYPLVNVMFEGYTFLAPKNYDKYLKKLYGNYMILPAEEDRYLHLSELTL